MQIVVNGQSKDIADEASVTALLEQLGLDARRVAVELNRKIVPRAQYGLTKLADQDQLEIVTLVGGG